MQQSNFSDEDLLASSEIDAFIIDYYPFRKRLTQKQYYELNDIRSQRMLTDHEILTVFRYALSPEKGLRRHAQKFFYEIIESGVDFNIRTKCGRSCTQCSGSSLLMQILEISSRRSTTTDEENFQLETFLVNSIQKIINNGGDVNKINMCSIYKNTCLPLWCWFILDAAKNNNVELVEVLIDNIKSGTSAFDYCFNVLLCNATHERSCESTRYGIAFECLLKNPNITIPKVQKMCFLCDTKETERIYLHKVIKSLHMKQKKLRQQTLTFIDLESNACDIILPLDVINVICDFYLQLCRLDYVCDI